ncbi:MAG TPA: hypothetical protein VFZ61_16540 [Polyangiales bacterium]
MRGLGLGAALLVLGCGGSPEREENDAAEPEASEAGADELDASDPAPDAATADSGDSLDAGAARLSETGLYADIAKGVLASGVVPFQPQGALWSDGADKQRWVYLPEGTRIDSTDMDAWRFPVGTKLWKEFALQGKRLETRLLEKTGDETWTQVAFQWNDAQTDALALPDGAKNVAGGTHDIPSTKDCKRCHEGVADIAIGFTAMLLAHDGPGVTLSGLAQAGQLTQAPTSALSVPGTSEEKQALLYLHANCGNCHNDRTFISNVTDVDYSLKHDMLTAVDQTNAYRTIQRDLRRSGSVAKSQLIRRMEFRGIQGQMPPIASEQVDQAGLALVRSWVSTLPAAQDGGVDGGSADAGP